MVRKGLPEPISSPNYKVSAFASFPLSHTHTLTEYIPSTLMIPSHRLDTLLSQAIQLQKQNCLYHNVETDETSLYIDHCCSRDRFPRVTTHIFEEHTDEVWFISFSHDGRWLASASKDMTAVVWSIEEWRQVQILAGHTNAISFLAWSPDDSLLLTGSNDNTLKVWNPKVCFIPTYVFLRFSFTFCVSNQTGACTQTFTRHNDTVTSCAWLPDGQRFVSGSVDKHIYLWNLEGDVLHKWSGIRVTDLAVSRDGRLMLAISEKKIRMYCLEDMSEVGYVLVGDVMILWVGY